MKEAMDMNVLSELEKRAVVAVLEIESAENAVPTAKALAAGGVTAIELALRTDAAEPSIALIKKEVPEMMIGIGTIILSGQAKRVKKAGASFGVAPGLNANIVKEAIACGLPFAPGVATASEIEQAYALGCKLLKLFPAGPLGGIPYLKSVLTPYKHLGLKYFPLGGVTEDTLADYAAVPQVAAIGGSWIATRDLISSKNWAEIERRSKKACEIWKGARS
ncbi:bifunctional 4-hydroxy-2-oxoglutarate aldolase/2-dehydro-3-deoxy-phosphogluconate aldolase [Treponema lecithinolyticum]|jgi:Entner-Doudoroff aldolase|uniref:KHG/KDPG aldolase n=1 Tax=Treponema lecithinolyticum ATCC 700332 TaxID=1321815 RepID=A0ABN0NZ17_TRELE|nr:bifunctional 4-hydroxy-2-oxoglutarate aldolase/2-dehydro-3-deoxy-phosphogluconate aldolase [Treponema lecithinolyticum]ERJ93301.1 putative KHG/KDPG aldolase [Treponema lecithinolyticum ATCC 700332]